jgi:hypothetical protein
MGFYPYSLQDGRDELVRKSDQQTKSPVTRVITQRVITQRPVLLKKESSVEKGVIAV